MITFRDDKRGLAGLFFCLWFMLPATSTQARQFQHIGIRQGLSDSYVRYIAKDHEGYMWFATLDGVNRFDGYRFRKYSQKGFGLYYDSFSWCEEDAGRHLWIKSSGGTIYLYDRGQDTLTTDLPPVLRALDLPETGLRNVTVDAAGDLWAEYADSLYIRDYRTGDVSAFAIPDRVGGIAGNGRQRFAAWRNGEIWQLSPEVRPVGMEEPGRIQLFLDTRDRLWSYTNLKPDVRVYDLRNGAVKELPAIFPGNDYVTAIVDDNNGRIWLGSGSSGIMTFNYDFGESGIISYDAADEFTLPSNHITCLWYDDNLLWVGTGKNGAAFTRMKQMRIEKTDLDISEDVSTIIEDADGALLYGLDGKGVIREKDGRFTKYLKDGSSLISDVITASARMRDGRIMFTSYGGGVFCWQQGRSILPWCKDPAFHKATEFSLDLCTDRNGNLWINTYDQGVACLRPDGTWLHYTTENSELLSNSMTSMTCLPDGSAVYVSTTECLYEISPDSQVLRQVSPFHQIRNLHADERGILWIGTTDGLWFLPQGPDGRDRPHLITIPDGLSHNHVQGICSDRKGNIWVTTNHGFTYIYIIDDPAEDGIRFRCYPYFEQDGTGECLFSKGAVRCISDGRIIMGGNGCIVTVFPDTFVKPVEAENLQFTEISVSDAKTVLRDGMVRMKYSDNLSVGISAMDYPNRHKIRYEYSLDHSGEWTLVSGNRIFLNRLPAGSHTVSVRIAGQNGLSRTKDLGVVVRPPFSRSVTALCIYIAVVLLFLSLVVLLIRERNRKLIDRERHKIDELTLKFFTSISHDLRTPLTLLLTPLNKLMKEYRGQPIEKELEIMNRNAHLLMNEINQLLDFRTLDLSKSYFYPLYGDLVKFVSEVCSSYGSLFSDDSVRLHTELCEESIMTDFDKEKILRILHNLLSHAFRNSPTGGTVTVSVRREGEEAVIRVADNGGGIREEDREAVFDKPGRERGEREGSGIGLHLVKEYVQMHDGTVSVTGNEPSGCVFTVRIPVRHVAPEGDAVAPPAEEMPVSGRPRVLVVEDNIPFRTYLAGCLAARYDVTEADNGKTALHRLGQSFFDIVVSDVMMPEMDGIRLCREIKNDIRFSRIPVILLTAVQSKETALRGLTEGADEYMLKPFDLDILILKIERLLARNREKAETHGTAEENESFVSRLDQDFLAKADGIIRDRLSDTDLSVDVLGTEIGVSRSGLYKKMIALTGKSPIEYIRMIRLQKGKEMIDNGETSVSQIAWNVGFSPKQFSKYFKEEYGCLPSEYLNHLRK